MRLRGLRFLTSVVVVVACGLTAWRGADFIRYSLAAQSIDTTKDPAAALTAWAAAPGLAAPALETLLRLPVNAADADALRRRAALLAQLLAVRPIQAQSWLELAAARSSMVMPAPRIAAAFSMSEVTGPNEGAVMFQRALFGVLLWEALTPDSRAGAIRDLVGLTAFNPTQFRIVLSAKPAATRAQVRAALIAAACPPQRIEAIGL